MIARAVLAVLIFAAGSAMAQTGCVVGQVLADTGSPLPGTQVVATAVKDQLFFRVTHTDQGGQFRVDDLLPGAYRIDTQNPDLGYTGSNNRDFSGTLGEVSVAADSGECAQITMRREPRAARLHLRLTDLSTGKEVSQPRAWFRRTDGHHAWDSATLYGRDLLVPPSKPLEVQLGAIGYEKTDVLAVAALEPGQVRTLSLQLRPIGLGCLTGTILNDDGMPVGSIKVQPLLEDDALNSKPLFVATDNKGKFTIRGLHPGVYEVFVDGLNRGYSGFSTMKTYGQFPNIHVLASPSCAETTIGLTPPGGSLHVEAIDATTQQPVEHFEFTVKSTTPKMYWTSAPLTNDRSQALVPPNKPCNLEVRADGYASSAPEFLGQLQPGEDRRVTVYLQPNAERH